jgi:hypothetical protein
MFLFPPLPCALPAFIHARLCDLRPVSLACRLINTWASKNWRQFSSVNYFDRTGIFISAVVSAPLCAVAFMVVIMQVSCCGRCRHAAACGVTWKSQVYQAGQLLIIVKRKVQQLLHENVVVNTSIRINHPPVLTISSPPHH